VGAALAKLRETTIRLVGTGRVPPALRRELQAAVGDLASRPTPACAPPPVQVGSGDGEGDGPGRGQGHGHKHGHKNKHGKRDD
jgi:hypothetical protein